MTKRSGYDTMAEHHEVHMGTAWDRLRPVLRASFAGTANSGVIVDIGAGSGLGTASLLGITDAEIIALEPNPTMRAMMVARLDALGALDRVTVMAAAAPDGLAELPSTVDGVVAAHMLGHLEPHERVDVLEWVAERLVPGGSAVITVSSGTAPVAESEPFVEERRVGRHRYRATHRSGSAGTYATHYEVLDGERVISSFDVEGRWVAVVADDVRAVLAGRDVRVEEPQPGVVVIRSST